jgi:hypothetical protein
MNCNEWLLSLSIAELKRVKRGVRLLRSLGFTADDALGMFYADYTRKCQNGEWYPKRAVPR